MSEKVSSIVDKVKGYGKNKIVISIIVGVVAGGSYYAGCFDEGLEAIQEHAPASQQVEELEDE